MIIWFTGQPGAGKTTLAQAFAWGRIIEHVPPDDIGDISASAIRRAIDLVP